MMRDMENHPARTRAGALMRGVVRATLLLGLAAVAAWWSIDEQGTGNKAFLALIACLLALVAVWGIAETRRELRLVPRRRPR